MITEERVDLWLPRFDDWWRCIPTNGEVRHDGQLVMGAGVARQAMIRYPTLPYELGTRVLQAGNVVHLFPTYGLISFPTKGLTVYKASLELIEESCQDLAEFAPILKNKKFVLPRPGCGRGERTWEEVSPIVYRNLQKVRAEIVVCYI